VSGSRIVLGGVEVTLDDVATGQDDVNAFALLEGTYTYDLGTQAGDTLEVAGLAYGAFYDEQTQLDLTVLEADVGPRFRLGPRGLPWGMTVRPYVAGSVVGLDRVVYSTTVAGGLAIGLQPTERLGARLLFDLRHDDYVESSRNPSNDERDALVPGARAFVRYVLARDLAAEVGLLVADNDADAGFRSFLDLGATAALVYAFPAPFLRDTDPWIASVSAGVRRADYDTPDPAIDPATSRRDDEWRVGAALTAALTRDLALVARIDYRDVQSNIELYTFDNFASSLALQWRF
jgi:hypothetical protein